MLSDLYLLINPNLAEIPMWFIIEGECAFHWKYFFKQTEFDLFDLFIFFLCQFVYLFIYLSLMRLDL